ncbi:MAG: DUF4058 family protein [Isosphaeraceae bacterium]
MPLRDHFRPARGRWDALHGGWPMMIATELNRRLPPPYSAAPRVHIGALEVDIAAFDPDWAPDGSPVITGPADVPASAPQAAPDWTPPEPTATIVADLPMIDEYEVRVYDTANGLLVAAIELVSPANKDRPESRGAFVTKCATMLSRRVCITIVDVATNRSANLFGELLTLMGQAGEFPAATGPLYAATCRRTGGEGHPRFETWSHRLVLGQPLPTLPLWLGDQLVVPLDLEVSYEETCRNLHLA